MNLDTIEFVNPDSVTVKSELNKDDDDYYGHNLDAQTCGPDNFKCGEIFTSNCYDFYLVCAECGCSFINTTDFGEHLRTLHQHNYTTLNVCGTILKTEPQPEIEHIEDIELEVLKKNEDKKKSSAKVKKPSVPKYICKFCNKHYKYRQSFERHNCQKTSKNDDDSSKDLSVEPAHALSNLNQQINSSNIKQQAFVPLQSEIDPSTLVNTISEPDRLGNIEVNEQNITIKMQDEFCDIKKETHEEGLCNPNLFCEICSRQFKYKSVFRKHGMQHEVAPIALQNDPTYRKCLYCGISFTDNAEWFRHENEHPKTGSLRCSQCTKKFRTEIELEVHVRCHGEKKEITCEQCGMQFSVVRNLIQHINRVHLHLKPFACEVCGKKFVRKVELDVHMRRHTGEKPYQCDECGRSFMISTLLKEHMKRHANIRDIQCPLCPMAFFTKKMLGKHMVKHSTERPYVCSTCGSTFSRKKALNTHKKIHMEIKEYVCNLCGKTFAQHAGLYMHKKTHMNGVEPYRL